MTHNEHYYLVREEALPSAIAAVARVKELLNGGKATLAEALGACGISKSTYYKYKDEVFAFHDLGAPGTVTMTLVLGHETGVLSRVLSAIAGAGGNVLMIHQELPKLGSAEVTLTVSLERARTSAGALCEEIAGIPGVLSAKLSGILEQEVLL